MKVKYQGTDIANKVDIKKADTIDNAGGIADSVELHFADPRGFWSQWQPQKNDQVELLQDGFSSGLMYIDELEQQRGLFIIKALSIPQEAKTSKTKAWDKVRFLEIAGDIAKNYGFQLKTYGITNHIYERVDQFEKADFDFLSWLCLLEGYVLKINDKSAIIYDERYMEAQSPVKTINLYNYDGQYRFTNKATGIFSYCKLIYGDLRSEFKPVNGPSGPTLKINDVYVSSLAEADRYSRNILRSRNKYEFTGGFTIELDSGIGAANSVQIKGIGLADGKHYCSKVVHRLVDKKTSISSRKPLEGY